MRCLRLVPIAVFSFGACSCSEVANDLEAAKSEQIRCQTGADCDLKWERGLAAVKTGPNTLAFARCDQGRRSAARTAISQIGSVIIEADTS
jgi:hypothetical protein